MTVLIVRFGRICLSLAPPLLCSSVVPLYGRRLTDGPAPSLLSCGCGRRAPFASARPFARSLLNKHIRTAAHLREMVSVTAVAAADMSRSVTAQMGAAESASPSPSPSPRARRTKSVGTADDGKGEFELSTVKGERDPARVWAERESARAGLLVSCGIAREVAGHVLAYLPIGFNASRILSFSDAVVLSRTGGPAAHAVDWDCIYRASRDGWTARDFHVRCDQRGRTVLVFHAEAAAAAAAPAEAGPGAADVKPTAVFGACCAVPWRRGGSATRDDSLTSFLFALRPSSSSSSSTSAGAMEAVRVPLSAGHVCAFVHDVDRLVIGADEIVIGKQPNEQASSIAAIGGPNGSFVPAADLLAANSSGGVFLPAAGTRSFRLIDMECFAVVRPE
jgi:hypothetical protein